MNHRAHAARHGALRNQLATIKTSFEVDARAAEIPQDLQQRLTVMDRLLAKVGLSTIPVVAGAWVAPDAADHARAANVAQVTDGRVVSEL